MGKSKLPGGPPALGIAAYQKTLGQKSAADSPPEGKPPESQGALRAFPVAFPELVVFPEMANSLPEGFLADEDAAGSSKPEPAKPPPRIQPPPWLKAAPLTKNGGTAPGFTKTVSVKTAAAPMPAKTAPASPAPPKAAGADAPRKGGFVKLTRSGPETPEKDSKTRRVAKFLILIGGEEASKILAGLDMEQVEAISKEIASIPRITAEEAEAVFTEFRSLLSSSYRTGSPSTGGVETARRLLHAAFGPEKGESFLTRAVPQSKENPFDFLNRYSAEQTVTLLREESPATAALILSRLPPDKSATVLAALPPERKFDVVKRIAYLGQTNAEVLKRVAGALREKAEKLDENGEDGIIPLDGRNALAAILKHTDLSTGGRLLEQLEEEDPALGQALKERLHTLEDVVKAQNKPIQEKLRSMEDRAIVLLLKGRNAEFTEKILSNVSAGRRQQIREESEILGPVPKREADEAVREFLDWFRQKREDGHILLIDDEDVIV